MYSLAPIAAGHELSKLRRPVRKDRRAPDNYVANHAQGFLLYPGVISYIATHPSDNEESDPDGLD